MIGKLYGTIGHATGGLEDPVRYWTEAAAAHREYAEHYAFTPGQRQLHEAAAVECDRKAAEEAAAAAFPLRPSGGKG